MLKPPFLRSGLGLAACVVLIDQATKAYFLALLGEAGGRAIEVTPFFNLVAVWNYGVSFGLFNTGSPGAAWVLAALALGVVGALGLWLRRAEGRAVAAALGLVIGGAIGNVIDRLRFGAVFDFLDVHARGWHWPAFNVADSAIFLGVAVLVIDALFAGPEKTK